MQMGIPNSAKEKSLPRKKTQKKTKNPKNPTNNLSLAFILNVIK